MKKIIALPTGTIMELQKLADKDMRKLKPYMEKVLHEHAKKKSK